MPRNRLSRRRVLASLGTTPLLSALPLAREQIESGHARDNTFAVKSEWVTTVTLRLQPGDIQDAAAGNMIILGGEASGPLLQGGVQPGTLEWLHDPVRNALQLTAHFDLQANDGRRMRVVDRAMIAAPRLTQCLEPVFTVPEIEVLSGEQRDPLPALYLSRMDAKQLGAGTLRMDVHRIL